MPVGQMCGACGGPGHNRRTCASEIKQLMMSVDASFDEVEGLLIKWPRREAQKLRDHMKVLVDDRGEALARAEQAELKLAGAASDLQHAKSRILELEVFSAAKDATIQRLIEYLHRLRQRNEEVVNKVRHLRAV